MSMLFPVVSNSSAPKCTSPINRSNSPISYSSGSSLNGKRVEKLTSPQIVFVNLAKLRFFADPLPIVMNGNLDPVNYPHGRLPGKQEMMRGSEAGFELTEPVFAGYEHGLGRFIAGTTLRANIIGRRQGQLLSHPKKRRDCGRDHRYCRTGY